MPASRFFQSRLALVFLFTFGCSDGATEGDVPLGSAGAVGTAGSGSAGLGAGGVSPSTGGTTPSAAGVTSGAGTGGTSNAGTTSGGSDPGGAPQGGAAGSGPAPTDGKGLYDANCKQCHMEQGAGSALGPELVHPVRDYSNWVVRNGRTLIAPWVKAMDKVGADKLSDAQLTLIWDYLDQPPQPTTGATLFGDYCANCHGADGSGGPTMRKLAGEGKNVLKLVREGKNVGQYAMRHDSMPKFDTTRITDAQLNLILAHVNTF